MIALIGSCYSFGYMTRRIQWYRVSRKFASNAAGKFCDRFLAWILSTFGDSQAGMAGRGQVHGRTPFPHALSLTVLICTTRSRLMCTRHDRPYVYQA